MDREAQIAKLEGILDEIKARSETSETRKKHLVYFIEGMRAEAKEMIVSARSAEFKDIFYSFVPTFAKPFEGTIKHSISASTGKAFSSAKGLYDNLNRFLQAAYISEEEILKREQDIASSGKDIATAFGEAYNLKKISQIANLGNIEVEKIIAGFSEISRGTALVNVLRNASEHGHKHVLLERSKDKEYGFVLSEGMTRAEDLDERLKPVRAILNVVDGTYLNLVNSFLQSYTQTDKNMRKLKPVEKAKLSVKKQIYQVSWASRFLGKYMVAPLAVVTLGLGVIGGCLNHGVPLYNSQKHDDEQTKRQLMELSDFQSKIMHIDKKAHEFCDVVDYLTREQAVLMSYTNLPADFDYQKVSNTLQRFKKASEAFHQKD